MNKYLYNDPTTKSKGPCLRKNAIDAEQASNNMMPMEIPPFTPLTLRGDVEGGSPYSKGDGETLIFERELVGKTELLRFWKS
jgi:hypothetical protein